MPQQYPHIHFCVCKRDSKLTRVHSVHGKDEPVHYSCALALCSSALRDLAVPVGDGLSTERVCVKCGRRAAVPQSDASGMTDLSGYLLAFHSRSVCLLMPLTPRSKAAKTRFP